MKMSLLKFSRLIEQLGKNTTKMYGSASKQSDTGSDGCDATKKNYEDNDDYSSPYAPNTFYSRKYSHELPTNTVPLNFDPLYGIPTGVFRDTSGETLGAGSDSEGSCYQNPEYFSFHHMSYYDFHLGLRKYRKESPQTGRKK